MTRRRLPLLAVVVLAAGLVVAHAAGPPVHAAEVEGDDVAFFRTVGERIRGGEGYYPVWAEESGRRRYPMLSVFNWRLPTHYHLLAALGDTPRVMAAFAGLGLTAIILGAVAVGRAAGAIPAAVFVLLALGSLLAGGNPSGVYLAESWAGFLMLLSVSAHALRWPAVAVAAGLAALFLRELAGPYVLLALGFAVSRRAWREAAAWGIGLVAFATFFAWHAGQVAAHRPADAFAGLGWLQFGGPRFAVTCARFNGWLLFAPGWVTPIYLAVALVGWVTANRLRLGGLTAVGYFAGFLVAGQPINDYWGLIPGPLLGMGVGLMAARRVDGRHDHG